MNSTLAILTVASLSLGMIAPGGEKPASPKQKDGAAAEADAKKPDAAMASLWVVRFDPALAREKLPFDVQGLRRDPENAARLGTRPDGRTPTNGWASQIQASEVIVEAAGHRLLLKNGQLTTEAIDPAVGASTSPPWTIVAAPRILVETGQEASLSVGRPVVHLVKESDGRLKILETPGAIEGVTIDLKLEWIKPKEIRFSSLKLRVSRVAGRDPVPGVPLDVGKPVMETRETDLGITLDEGKIGVIPLPERADEAPILVFLTAAAQK